MSCNCNSKRQNGQRSSSFSQQPSEIQYRYIGAGSLTVTGGATQKVYHFANPGDVALIDSRDVPGMTGVPNVRQEI